MLSNEYRPNELVVAVRLTFCASVRVTTAFRSAMPNGVKTLPPTVTVGEPQEVESEASSSKNVSLPVVPAGRL